MHNTPMLQCQRNEKYKTQTLIVNHVGLKAWVCKLTLGRTCKFRYKGGGGMEPLPGVFDMFQYFETILSLVESLWSS